ncbi:hypothetical protein Nepgr_026422 [Nepenthes gracilis]|uniref:VQ domain-containing protein n=1 Tax=Nepenthes gracilis TaxID=150966 RepID=A0AAD3T8F2_NEPGR|nr:hypothetical protein Nepgr_026422 [Nepenthes gracilis]
MVSFSQNSSSSFCTCQASMKQKPITSSSLHLHSIHKPSPPSKPPKKPALPQQPGAAKQTKVYNVKPKHFRELVQQLTGAPEFQRPTRRLQSFAPPTLQCIPAAPAVSSYIATSGYGVDQLALRNAAFPMEMMGETLRTKQNEKISESGAEGLIMVGTEGSVCLSPGFQTWCALSLLSPETLATMDQRSAF